MDAKNVQAANFSIDGLTVSNAAVKQTDSKTVVLTTSTQEGGKQYTVKSGAATLGKFIGVSAVTPESISVTTNSLQGVVGKEVTVKAQVKVKDGESKAGIPVTFNISAGNKKFNKDYVVEVYTNEEGIAQYSYTQYAGGEDLVTAYATGNANVRSSSGKVYWGVKERLTISEVKEGNALTNGAKKVYKVKATTEAGGSASGYVNVAFAENVDVTPDKAVTTVEVTDGSEYGVNKYPYQYTTGGTSYVRVKLDSAGEATFTVSGKDASVTPIVFFDGEYNTDKKWTGNNVLDATELQAKAATVKFEAIQAFGLTVESKGVKEAASITDYGRGGRDYKAVVTDKDGKLAPKGTKVYIVFKEANITKKYVDGAVQLFDLNEEKRYNVKLPSTGEVTTPIELTTNDKGEIEFTLEGKINNFATPTVYLETGDKPGLDKNDLQKDGEVVYFGEASIKTAALKVTDSKGKEVKTLTAPADATFTYQSVDQNGKAYYDKDKNFTTTFEVTAGFSDVTVGSTTVKAGKTESIKVDAKQGKASITVHSDGVSDVKVTASASQNTLPDLDASVSFTKYSESKLVTGLVKGFDVDEDEVTLQDKNGATYAYSYAGATYQNDGNVIDKPTFEGLLAQGIEITVTKDDNGKVTFNVLSTTADTFPTAPSIDEFVDTDVDAGQIAGDVKFTSTKGLDYKIYLGSAKTPVTTGTVDDTNSVTYTIADDTDAVDQIKVVVTNSKGYSASSTINVTDVGTTASEKAAALSKINTAALNKVWDGVTIKDFETAGVTGVTEANFKDVKKAVQEERALHGGALDTADIQKLVPTTPKP